MKISSSSFEADAACAVPNSAMGILPAIDWGTGRVPRRNLLVTPRPRQRQRVPRSKIFRSVQSIARRGWVRILRPCVNTARKIQHMLETHPRQVHRDLRAADAVMAYDDRLAVGIELGQARRDIAHRDM